MAPETDPTSRIESLAAEQHWVVHRRQLVFFGLTDDAIRHRVATGWLHPRWPKVYAVGRAALSRRGEWMAAVLTCGPGASLSHLSAAVLWGICPREFDGISVSIPRPRRCRRAGIAVHRPIRLGPEELTKRDRIPVTSPLRTLIDVAASESRAILEAAVNEAIGRRLTSVERVQAALATYRHQPGVRALTTLLDAATFRLTRSHLERLFIPIALRAGLPRPLTQELVNGYEVDFYWPDLGLVVETDGGSFHRTAAEQTRDRLRDQAHTAAGLTQLRFTHDQVAHAPGYVENVLRRVSRRTLPAPARAS